MKWPITKCFKICHAYIWSVLLVDHFIMPKTFYFVKSLIMALIFPVLTLSMPAAFTNYLPYLCIEVDNIQRKGQKEKGKNPTGLLLKKHFLLFLFKLLIMLVYDFTDCWSSWCNALLITNQIKTCYYTTSVFWMISEVIYYFLFFWNKKLACFFNHILLAALTIWTDCKLQLVGFFLEIYLLYLEERELFCVHILMKFRVCQHICSRKKYKYTNISVKWVLFRVNPESVDRFFISSSFCQIWLFFNVPQHIRCESSDLRNNQIW